MGDLIEEGKIAHVGVSNFDVDLLEQAPAADRQVVMHFRRVQMQPVIVDHVHIGLVARRNNAAIGQSD